MIKRQKILKNTSKNEKTLNDNKTFTVPKIVDEPKTKEEKKRKILAINRENNETNLESTWLDPIQKLSPTDLGIINDSKSNNYYPENKKKDRHYNRGVNRAITDLKLLIFLISNLKPHYKNQIFSSPEFVSLIQKYLSIDDYSNKLTKEENDQALAIASQMLINSLTVIKKLMPPQFDKLLKQNGKPYFDTIQAISDFARENNIKKIPQIHIPDSLR